MNNKLIVLWVTRDEEAATNMAFMYAKNSRLKGWWDEVGLIIWGPSAEVAAQNKAIQLELEQLKDAGVKLRACRACAERYGVVESLEKQGIEVIYIGSVLSAELQSGTKVLTV